MEYKKWECIVCGLIYDEELGWPDDGIAPGTAWDDVPDDWLCPDCGVGKEDFEMTDAGDDWVEYEDLDTGEILRNNKNSREIFEGRMQT